MEGKRFIVPDKALPKIIKLWDRQNEAREKKRQVLYRSQKLWEALFKVLPLKKGQPYQISGEGPCIFVKEIFPDPPSPPPVRPDLKTIFRWDSRWFKILITKGC